jgi:lysophospholipid acyltransferase (LPLAT)-like uncharacterized protein
MKLKEIKYFLVGISGSIFIRLLASVITIKEIPGKHPEELKRQGKKVIFALWHSSMLVPAYASRNLGFNVLISRHSDGEYIARVIQRLGNKAVRGSTTRGGARALLSMIKKIKEEDDSLAITPDGPKGPRFIVQPGVIFLAQKAGYPIVPVSLGLTKYWELPSWDRFRIPKPFSKAVMIYGEPITIPPKLERSEVEEYRKLLEKRLNEMGIEADRMVKDM